MTQQGDWQELARFESENAYGGGFGLEISPNKAHVLVHIQLPYEKDAPEKFQLRMFNAAMMPEWDREYCVYGDKEFSFEDFRVDNNGSAILIGVKYAEKREAKALKRAHKVHYDYHLLTYSADGSEQDHTIKVGERFLQDLTLSLDTGKADIMCGGFFGNKGENKVRECLPAAGPRDKGGEARELQGVHGRLHHAVHDAQGGEEGKEGSRAQGRRTAALRVRAVRRR